MEGGGRALHVCSNGLNFGLTPIASELSLSSFPCFSLSTLTRRLSPQLAFSRTVSDVMVSKRLASADLESPQALLPTEVHHQQRLHYHFTNFLDLLRAVPLIGYPAGGCQGDIGDHAQGVDGYVSIARVATQEETV